MEEATAVHNTGAGLPAVSQSASDDMPGTASSDDEDDNISDGGNASSPMEVDSGDDSSMKDVDDDGDSQSSDNDDEDSSGEEGGADSEHEHEDGDENENEDDDGTSEFKGQKTFENISIYSKGCPPSKVRARASGRRHRRSPVRYSTDRLG